MGRIAAMVLLPLAMIGTPALAQVRSVDPDQAIDGDLSQGQPPAAAPDAYAAPDTTPPPPPARADETDPGGADGSEPSPRDAAPAGIDSGAPAAVKATAAVDGRGDTYHQDDLIGAAEGVFGKGAKGLAGVIEGILKKQGEPNGYIVGREGGGAFIAGVRYGSGTLYHKIEGERPVYWTGPSIGFDAGANVASAFVLVYNLYDSQDLYKRFVAGEGQAYFIGGFNVSYLRHGDIVLIPVRLGAGLRLGANIGYMKFSQKQRWLPF